MLIDAHTSDQELINLAIEMGKDMKITVPIVEIPLSFCVYENQPDTARVDFINTDKYGNPVVTRYKERRMKK